MTQPKSPTRKSSPSLPAHRFILKPPTASVSVSGDTHPRHIFKDTLKRNDIIQHANVLIALTDKQLREIHSRLGSGYEPYLDGYTFTNPSGTADGYLGAGAFGTVFALDKVGKLPRVIKISCLKLNFAHDVFDNEVKLNNMMNHVHPSIAPYMHSNGTYRHNGILFGFIVSDRVSMTLANFLRTYVLNSVYTELLYKNLVTFFDLLCKHDIVHMDMHFENIGVVFQADRSFSFQLMDWGSADFAKCDPCVELGQMIRILRRDIRRERILRANISPIKYVLNNLIAHYGCDMDYWFGED